MIALLTALVAAAAPPDPLQTPPIPDTKKNVTDEQIEKVAGDYRAGRHSESARGLRWALHNSVDGQRPKVLLYYGQSLAALGFPDAGLRYLVEVIRVADERDLSAGSAVLRLSDLAFNNGQYLEIAETVLGHPAGITPGANALRWISIRHHLDNDDPEAAKALFIKTNPDGWAEVVLNYTEGLLLLEEGKMKSAKAKLSAARDATIDVPDYAIDTGHVLHTQGRASVALGELYTRVDGKEATAAGHFEAVPNTTPGWPDALLRAIDLRLGLKDVKTAEKDLKLLSDKKVLKTVWVPERHLAAALIAHAECETGARDKALDAFEADVKAHRDVLAGFSEGWDTFGALADGPQMLVRLKADETIARYSYQLDSVAVQRGRLEGSKKLPNDLFTEVDGILGARSKWVRHLADPALREATKAFVEQLDGKLQRASELRAASCP